MRQKALFYLNGQVHEVGGERTGAESTPAAGMMLADYLRQERGLTGTKIVCAEGDCGACTVLRLTPTLSKKTPSLYLPVNACVIPVASLDGASIVTVDALAQHSTSDPNPPHTHATATLTPVQQAMMNCHGSQCGFCTPGFVMALSGLVEKRLCEKSAKPISEQDAKNALTGNLCRCTGYQPIIDAATAIDLKKSIALKDRFYSREQEKHLAASTKKPLLIETEEFSFFAPKTLKDAAKYLAKYPDARLIAGSTDLGVVHNKRKIRATHLLSLHLIPELKKASIRPKNRISIGASVTLSELRETVKDKIPELANFLNLFASPQIRNIATLAGNVGNASPIGDLPPFLLVSSTQVIIQGPKAKRVIPLESFYKGYRKTALKKGELISAIEFDIPSKAETLKLSKVSQRKDLDISAINSAIRAEWTDSKKSKLRSIRIAFGGVAATPIRLTKTEAALKNSAPTPEAIDRALLVLHTEMHPISDLRGSFAFRRIVAENLLRRFFK